MYASISVIYTYKRNSYYYVTFILKLFITMMITNSKTINEADKLVVETYNFKCNEILQQVIFEEAIEIIPKSEPQEIITNIKTEPNDYGICEKGLDKSFPILTIKKEKIEVEEEKSMQRAVLKLKRLEFFAANLQANSRYNLRPRKSSYIFLPLTSYIFTPRKKRNGFLKKKIVKTIKIEKSGVPNKIKSCKVNLKKIVMKKYNT